MSIDKTTRRKIGKIAGFAAVIVLGLLVAGSDIELRKIRKLMLIYVLGAFFAFWTGGEPIGTFRPISMRPLAILLGVIVMIYALAMMLFIKDALPQRERPGGGEHASRPAPVAPQSSTGTTRFSMM